VIAIAFTSTAFAGKTICLTNSFGEQTTLVYHKTSPKQFDLTGSINYQPAGGTIWPVTSGHYDGIAKTLVYTATNPSPDGCTYWASTVTFNYTYHHHTYSGTFSNDCPNSGSLTATWVLGSCGFAPVPGNIVPGSTGSHQNVSLVMNQITLAPCEDLNTILDLEDLTVSPNPALTKAEIAASVADNGQVAIRIYDSFGKLIRTIQSGNMESGDYTFGWDLNNESGAPVQTGTYIIQMETSTGVTSSRVSVVR
jgi:hypothetical protein